MKGATRRRLKGMSLLCLVLVLSLTLTGCVEIFGMLAGLIGKLFGGGGGDEGGSQAASPAPVQQAAPAPQVIVVPVPSSPDALEGLRGEREREALEKADDEESPAKDVKEETPVVPDTDQTESADVGTVRT